jgi:DNA-binding PadR family transcriptional regulator
MAVHVPRGAARGAHAQQEHRLAGEQCAERDRSGLVLGPGRERCEVDRDDDRGEDGTDGVRSRGAEAEGVADRARWASHRVGARGVGLDYYVQRSNVLVVRDVQLLVLTALAGEPMHGHRIRDDVEALSGRPVGPGTLYGAIERLGHAGHIRSLPLQGRRQPYELTALGRQHLAEEITRTRALVDVVERRLGGAAWTG